MEAGLVARIESLPSRVDAVRIVRKNCLEALGGGARKLDKFIADGAMAAEDAVLHAEFLHLLQDHGGRSDVRPQQDRIDAGIFDDLKLATEVGVAPHKLLLDNHRMAKTAGGIAELDDPEAAVAVVHAQDCDPL